MADKKISQLTAASTPLAGTEVLPIVQSGSTVKVSSDDLTVKNIRSNATNGILQVAGPGAGTTRVMTTPNANFTAARTDAGQTFSGTQTFAAIGTAGNANLGNSANNVSGGGYTHRFSGKSISPDGSTWLSSYGAVVFNAGVDYTGSARRYLVTNALDQKKFAIIRSVDGTTDPALGNGGAVSSGTADFVITDAGDVEIGTGNVKISTAAKGIDFSANTGAAGMTSELLNWYETGTWTPTLTCTDGNFNSVTYDPLRGGRYTRVGNMVHVQCYMRTDAVDNSVGRSGDVLIAGLPFAAVTASSGTIDGHASLAVSVSSAWAGEEPIAAFISGGDTNIQLLYRTAVDGNTSNTVAADVGTGANANIVLIAGTYICA
jgi:hypothetical protein